MKVRGADSRRGQNGYSNSCTIGRGRNNVDSCDNRNSDDAHGFDDSSDTGFPKDERRGPFDENSTVKSKGNSAGRRENTIEGIHPNGV